MYCVKCKLKTESINIIQVTSKNNRRMLKEYMFCLWWKKVFIC